MFKMNSINSKIIFSVVGLLLFSFLFLCFFSSIFMTKEYLKEIELNHEKSCSMISNSVLEFLNKSYALTEQLAINDEILNFDPTTQTKIIKKTNENNNYMDLIYIQNAKGMQTSKTRGTCGDRSGRPWFKKVLTLQKPFITDSYFSLTGNVPVTSIIFPMFDTSAQFIGAIGTDIKLGALQKIVDNFSNKNMYAFIVDGQGNLIAHPNTEQIKQMYNYLKGTKKTLEKSDGSINFDADGNQIEVENKIKISGKLKEIVRKGLDGKSGFQHYKNFYGDEVYGAYTPIKLKGNSNQWAVITVQKKDAAFAFVNKVQKKQYLIIFFLLVISGMAIMFFSKRLVKPINMIEQNIKKLADGNVIETINIKSNMKEIQSLCESMNKLIEYFNKLILQAKIISEDDLNNKILNERVKGDLGSAFAVMKTRLKNLSEQAQIIASEDVYNEKLEIDGKGTLGKAFSEMVINLRNILKKAEIICNDDLNNKELEIKSGGDISKAFYNMILKLKKVAENADLISAGKFDDDKLNLEENGVLGKSFYRMTTNLKKMSMQASALANNDLNNMILNEKIEGEFGNNFYRMSRNLKNLISNLEQIIGKVKSVSNGIIKTSELITNSALDINEKVEVQSVIAKDNEVFLNQFNSSINKISDNCDDTTSNASNSTKLLRKGLEIIDDINNEMANMRDSIKTTGSKLNELSESGRKISNIIDMITGISEKTALLALNAAIEAARAGESGRGFAVVADEVNKLAEQTNKSVKEISMLVETIKTQTDLSVESMNENIKLVEKVVEFIDNTSGSFNQINSAVDETSKSINTISDTVEEQNEAIKSMIENSDKLKNISEQFSVSAVSLTENGKELKSFADNLEEVLNAKI